MDGAALLALFAAVGFGWQPMPDGSERYEYIVQVDEELAATIASGKSIPIVGDVPEGIHPIGRVRLVVGDDALPRERLVTRLKPVVASTADADAGTAQAATADAGDKSIVVRGQNATTPFNPYAAAPAPAPSGSQLFESASTAATQAWNENVAAPASQALASAGQNLQDQLGDAAQQQYDNAANQLQQGVNNLGQNLQNSASSLGNRSKGIVDELGRSLTQQPAPTARSVRTQAQAAPLTAVAPPATGAAAGAAPYNGSGAAAPVNNWNPNTLPPATNPLRQDASVLPPAQAQAQQQAPGANEWNGQQNPNAFPPGPPLAQPNPNTFAGGQPSPAPAASSAPSASGNPTAGDVPTEWNNAPELTNTATAPPAATGNGFGNPNAAGNNGTLAEGDPWRGVPDPQAPVTSGAAAPNLAGGQPAPFGGAGTNWPGGTSPAGSNTNLGVSPPFVAGPAIRDGMLDQSPNRPLEGPGSLAAAPAGTNATNVSTNGGNAPPSVTRDIVFPNKQPSSTNPAAQPPSNPLAAQPNAANGTPNAASGDNAVVTLVAWVLLFGSAFGNLYLFWSYLDVRQKYRSLVRKTARAVGSRFSAA